MCSTGIAMKQEPAPAREWRVSWHQVTGMTRTFRPRAFVFQNRAEADEQLETVLGMERHGHAHSVKLEEREVMPWKEIEHG